MRIVFLAGDAEFDYRLDVDPDRNPTVADLVAALAGPDVDPTVGLSIDGRFAPPVTPLAVAALREGSTCTLAAGPVDEGSTGPALAVTAGLGAGETFVVGPAPASLGRAADNGIVLE
jgi:hypothetical protein